MYMGYVVIDLNLIEHLIIDDTIDELGIRIISFRKGLEDPLNVVRESTNMYIDFN